MRRQRNTKQRQLVLDAVRARCDHPNADQIYLDVRAMDERISRGTVYRNLNVLVHQGEILHVKAPHADRFEGRLDAHYHLLCTQCGTMCDMPLPYRADLDAQAAQMTDCRIERHTLFFYGLCPDCQGKEDPSKQ